MIVPTHGGGIFRANIWAYNQGNSTLSNALTYAKPKIITNNFQIQSGGYLKTTSTIFMPGETTITVQSGGKLEIDGGEIKYGKVVVESGGQLIVKNGGRFEFTRTDLLEIKPGGLLTFNEGEVFSFTNY